MKLTNKLYSIKPTKQIGFSQCYIKASVKQVKVTDHRGLYSWIVESLDE